MTGRLLPRNAALRDQILAVLRGAYPRLLTIEDVIKAVYTRPVDSPEFWWWRHHSNTYVQLRAMDRAGVIEWHGWYCRAHGCEVEHPDPREQRMAYWRAAPWDQETGITVADLDALLTDGGCL
jgi:hypothetical protein